MPLNFTKASKETHRLYVRTEPTGSEGWECEVYAESHEAQVLAG